MAGNAWVPIATSEGVESMTFSNIPQIYKDLFLVCTDTSSKGSSFGSLLLNDLTTGYKTYGAIGNSTTVSTPSWTNTAYIPFGVGPAFALYYDNYMLRWHIGDYSSTTKTKQIIARYDSPSNAYTQVISATNSTTNAITSLTISGGYSNNAYLYGIVG